MLDPQTGAQLAACDLGSRITSSPVMDPWSLLFWVAAHSALVALKPTGAALRSSQGWAGLLSAGPCVLMSSRGGQGGCRLRGTGSDWCMCVMLTALRTCTWDEGCTLCACQWTSQRLHLLAPKAMHCCLLALMTQEGHTPSACEPLPSLRGPKARLLCLRLLRAVTGAGGLQHTAGTRSNVPLACRGPGSAREPRGSLLILAYILTAQALCLCGRTAWPHLVLQGAEGLGIPCSSSQRRNATGGGEMWLAMASALHALYVCTYICPRYVMMPEHHDAFITHLHALGH